MGRRVAGCGFCSPGVRPDVSRSSWQVAQGQALRSHANPHELWWPSFQSISRPVPSVLWTRTFTGSLASRGSSRCSCSSRRACSALTRRMPSWLILSLFSQKRRTAALSVVPDLQHENGQGQGEREAVGENHGKGSDEDAVEQPEKNTEREDQEHDERYLVRAFETVNADELWDKGDGGADGGDRADEVNCP